MNELPQEKIALIIPAYNEEATIGIAIDSVSSIINNIFVLDGNSTDNTRAVASGKGVNIIIQKEKGKGAALLQAIREIDKEILVFMDADCSHEGADIPKLLKPILNNEADLVVASRMLGGSDELHGTWNNFVRMTGSSLLGILINCRWDVNLTDIENGFRAIRRKVALDINLKAKDFTIEQEMVMKTVKKGYLVKEVASHEYERKAGESKLPTSQGWKFILNFLENIF